MKSQITLFGFCIIYLNISRVTPFQFTPILNHHLSGGNRSNFILLSSSDPEDERLVNYGDIWNPSGRKAVATLSIFGSLETAYLTYEKVFSSNGMRNICGGDTVSISSCSSVLSSPYASIRIGEIEIPLTAIGCIAYSTVALLAVYPLFKTSSRNDENNRLAILFLTTSMATFSSFLFSLLLNVLHQNCPWCYLSSFLSVSMGFTSWMSGALPSSKGQEGVQLGFSSFISTTVAALFLFLSADEASMIAYSNNAIQGNGLNSNVVASAKEQKLKNMPPPPITAASSAQAIKIGDDLKSLEAKFYGAYWCSHCFEQKQRLGKEAFYSNVHYIECSPEGLNSQSNLCKEKDIPGYPTWEIGGKLFPGEMFLDELEDIIKDVRTSKIN